MSTKKAPRKHIDELHADHRLWTNNMKFYLDELTIFENRLGELVTKNTKLEVVSQIEHFQNQFILQKEVADQLIRKCKDHDKFLANQAKANPVAIDHVLFADHTKLHDETATYDKLYKTLKKDYMKFLRKWM